MNLWEHCAVCGEPIDDEPIYLVRCLGLSVGRLLYMTTVAGMRYEWVAVFHAHAPNYGEFPYAIHGYCGQGIANNGIVGDISQLKYLEPPTGHERARNILADTKDRDAS